MVRICESILSGCLRSLYTCLELGEGTIDWEDGWMGGWAWRGHLMSGLLFCTLHNLFVAWDGYYAREREREVVYE